MYDYCCVFLFCVVPCLKEHICYFRLLSISKIISTDLRKLQLLFTLQPNHQSMRPMKVNSICGELIHSQNKVTKFSVASSLSPIIKLVSAQFEDHTHQLSIYSLDAPSLPYRIVCLFIHEYSQKILYQLCRKSVFNKYKYRSIHSYKYFYYLFVFFLIMNFCVMQFY